MSSPERQTVCVVGWPDLEFELLKYHLVAKMGLRLTREGGSIAEIIDAYVQGRLYDDNILTVFYSGDEMFTSAWSGSGPGQDSEREHGICALRGSIFKSEFFHHTVAFTPRSQPRDPFVKRLWEGWLGPFSVEPRGAPLCPTVHGKDSCFASYEHYFNSSQRSSKMTFLLPPDDIFVYSSPDCVEVEPPPFAELDLLVEPKRPRDRVSYRQLFEKANGGPVGVDVAVDGRHLVVLPAVDDQEHFVIDFVKSLVSRWASLKNEQWQTRWDAEPSPTNRVSSQKALSKGNTIRENAIVLHPAICQITFKGRTVSVPVSKGLRVILTLLHAPGRKISALDLDNPPELTAEWQYLRQHQETDRHNDDDDDTPVPSKATTDNRPVMGKAHMDDIIPPDVIDLYKKRLADLRILLKNAQDADEWDTVDEYKEEIAALEETLQKNVSYGNDEKKRSRRFGDERERARTAVKKCIVKAIALIDAKYKHKALAAHLKTYIDTGYECVYRRDANEKWNFKMED